MRIVRFFLAASCLLNGMAWAGGDAAAQSPERYLPRLAAAERSVADLPPAALVKGRTPELDTAVRAHAVQLQELAAQRAFVGDTEGALAAFDAQEPDSPPMPDAAQRLTRLADARAEDAIQAIVEQARTRRVVILNEAHHVPMHRVFAMRLAQALRKLGYTHIACETFSAADGDMRVLAPGQAIAGTGYYVREPNFAAFVNAALADGWTPIAYDVAVPRKPGQGPIEWIGAREQAQADNLARRIFATSMDAKVFIYVGYAHAYKSRPAEESIDWMAERLRRATGLDIVSVDQTAFHPHASRASEHPLYAGLLAAFPSDAPFVLRMADGSHPVFGGGNGESDLRGRIDMQVIFPRYAIRDGRPDWLHTLAGRRPRPLPAELLPRQGRRLVKVLRMDALPDAVPVDIVLVEAGKRAPVLMLPPGEFRFVVEDE